MNHLFVDHVQVLLAGGGAVVLLIRAVDLLLLGVDVLPQPAAAHPGKKREKTHEADTTQSTQHTNRDVVTVREKICDCESKQGEQRRGDERSSAPWINKA